MVDKTCLEDEMSAVMLISEGEFKPEILSFKTLLAQKNKHIKYFYPISQIGSTHFFINILLLPPMLSVFEAPINLNFPNILTCPQSNFCLLKRGFAKYVKIWNISAFGMQHTLLLVN